MVRHWISGVYPFCSCIFNICCIALQTGKIEFWRLFWSEKAVSGMVLLSYVACCLLQIIVLLFCQKHHPKGLFLANQYQNVDKIIIIWGLASSLPQGVFVLNLFVFWVKPAWSRVGKGASNWYPGKDRLHVSIPRQVMRLKVTGSQHWHISLRHT